jgi:hypothetical protein
MRPSDGIMTWPRWRHAVCCPATSNAGPCDSLSASGCARSSGSCLEAAGAKRDAADAMTNQPPAAARGVAALVLFALSVLASMVVAAARERRVRG